MKCYYFPMQIGYTTGLDSRFLDATGAISFIDYG